MLNGGECNPHCNPGDPLIELVDEAEYEGAEWSRSLSKRRVPRFVSADAVDGKPD